MFANYSADSISMETKCMFCDPPTEGQKPNTSHGICPTHKAEYLNTLADILRNSPKQPTNELPPALSHAATGTATA